MKKIKIQKTLESCPKMFGMATLMAFSIFASKFHRTNRLQKTLIVLKSYLNLTLLLYNKSLNVCFLVKQFSLESHAMFPSTNIDTLILLFVMNLQKILNCCNFICPQEMLKKDIKLLRAYPVVYMVLSIFPSINRFSFVISQLIF